MDLRHPSQLSPAPQPKRARLLARLRQEDGQGLVEWALIVGGISIAAVAITSTVGVNILNMLTTAANAI
jgi:Flp pilus assembly pilin Flp